MVNTSTLFSQSIANQAQTGPTTRFLTVGGEAGISATEAEMQCLITDSLTWGNLFVNVEQNSLTGSGSTVTSRIGAAPGNQTVSIIQSTTGIVEDLVNTDTLVSGQLIDYSVVTTSGTGNLGRYGLSSTLSDSSANMTSLNICSLGSGITLSGNTNSPYEPIQGKLARASVGGTDGAGFTINTSHSGVWSFLSSYVTANSLGGSGVTVNFRTRGTNRAPVLNIVQSTTGLFTDTSNSFTEGAVSSSGVNYRIIPLSGGGSIRITNIQIKAQTTTGSYNAVAGSSSGWVAQGTNVTRFLMTGGGMSSNTTESQSQRTVRGVTLSGMNLFVNITANSFTSGTTTVTSRKNGAPGNLTTGAIVPGTTGNFFDNTNADAYALGDNINYAVTTSNLGTGNVVLDVIGMRLDQVTITATGFFQHSGPLRLKRFNRN